MDDGDGAFVMELRAGEIASRLASRNNCPSCGMAMDPVSAMYQGRCSGCTSKMYDARVKGLMNNGR